MTASTPANRARPSTFLAELCEPGVIATELYGPADPAGLYPEELADAVRFGAQRRAEFAAGRLCAKLALEMLGYAHFPLRIEADRRPRWPSDIVGSISHTRDVCAALVANVRDMRAIGFDVETRGRIEENLFETLFTPRELTRILNLNSVARDLAATLIFSAKESFYKCQYILTKRWLEFTDVEVLLEPAQLDRNGIFTIRSFQSDLDEARYDGKFLFTDDVVATRVFTR